MEGLSSRQKPTTWMVSLLLTGHLNTTSIRAQFSQNLHLTSTLWKPRMAAKEVLTLLIFLVEQGPNSLGRQTAKTLVHITPQSINPFRGPRKVLKQIIFFFFFSVPKGKERVLHVKIDIFPLVFITLNVLLVTFLYRHTLQVLPTPYSLFFISIILLTFSLHYFCTVENQDPRYILGWWYPNLQLFHIPLISFCHLKRGKK